MPFEVWYFVAIIAVSILWFVILKRPMYEAMALAFVACLALTGTWGQAFSFMKSAAKTSILYTIIAFLMFAEIVKRTGVIAKVVDIIIALVGRISGGAGVVAWAASTFLSFLAGSGPGNCVATGSITIPLMKRAGYSSELAGGIGMACATLGPIVPPASTIAASYACLTAVLGEDAYTVSEFWTVIYAVAAWYILHRLVQTIIMCKVYKVKKLDKSMLPDLKQAWKNGWSSLLLVVVVMLPFILDATCDSLFTRVLGADARKNLSNSLLIFTPAVASAYCLLIGRKDYKVSVKNIADTFVGATKSIAPMCAMLFFSYSISALMVKVDAGTAISEWLSGFNMSFFTATMLVLLVSTILGMFLSGTSVLPLFGPIFITMLMGYGVQPAVTAALLIPLFVGLGQMTIPFAPVFYPAMGIAEADFGKMTVHSCWWALGHLIVTALIIFGILPILFV